jgi:hypothetical protein
MVTTRGQAKVAGNASGSTGTPMNKVTKKMSKTPVKTKPTPAKKAGGGMKATGGEKEAPSIRETAGKREIANEKKKPKKEKSQKEPSSGSLPLQSPTDSVGDLIPHRKNDNTVLDLARQGMQNKATDAMALGIANPGWMCYCNSVITMLLNITPFVGYVNRVHGSNIQAGLTDPDTGAPLENPETDLLSRLNELAIAYWSTPTTRATNKQTQINRLVMAFWNYTMDLNAFFNAAPWNPGKGKDKKTFQDAADYLSTILNIAVAQLSANPNIS